MPTSIVTTAPPNPNGDLHVGHLSGPFLGADVLARHLRAIGHDVVHVSYIDEHSCYVPRRAREMGAPTRSVAHYLGSRIEQTLAMAYMSPDFCGRPHRDRWHDETVAAVFTTLWERGIFEVAATKVYHCLVDGIYLYEAEVRGRCHHCGEPSDGFYCEECGRPQESGELRDPKCTTCWTAPELVEHPRIVFPLDQFRAQLAEYYKGQQLRPRLRDYLDGMLAEPLPATPVSRIGDYGVPVPLPEWDGHYLDTWFSGICGYIAATEGAATVVGVGPGAAAWSDPDTRVYEFLGFDCSFSHALLWPAMCLAADLALPTTVFTNEFYRLEGGKFSTSRGHAIWGADILSEVPPDSLRFYLCLTGPETEQTNFVFKHFQSVAQEVLVDGLEQIVDALAARREESSGGTGRIAELAAELAAAVADALNPARFSPAAATEWVRAFCVDRRAEVDAAIAAADSAAAEDSLRHLAAAVAAIMPGWSTDVLRALGAGPREAPRETEPAQVRLDAAGGGPAPRSAGVPRRSLDARPRPKRR